jgi:hypothetical protein
MPEQPVERLALAPPAAQHLCRHHVAQKLHRDRCRAKVGGPGATPQAAGGHD